MAAANTAAAAAAVSADLAPRDRVIVFVQLQFLSIWYLAYCQ